MKTEYHHIKFLEAGELTGKYWEIRNRRTNDLLGEIGWYGRWQSWVFCGRASSVFDTTCLQDIIHFMDQLKGAEN